MPEEFANQLTIRVKLGVEPQHTLPFIKKYIKEDFSQYTVNGNQKCNYNEKVHGELSYQNTSD